MKVSIITVSLNSAATIEDTISSVLCQDYPHIEYIVIDGGSLDGTLHIINRYRSRIARFVSEPDMGIYDAMNKGIKLASGDVVGFLNTDDFYVSGDVIEKVIQEFYSTGVDSVFADLVYIKKNNPDEVVRYYRSSSFHPQKFAYGWMPAHPTFFVRRICYEKYGLFKTDYKIAADYELMVRFLAKHKMSYNYIPRVIVKMRTGGASTKNIKSNFILNAEIMRACRENGVETNLFKIYSKYFVKWFQLLNRPR